MSVVRKKAEDIADKYIGKTPDDFGLIHWADVKALLVKEILSLKEDFPLPDGEQGGGKKNVGVKKIGIVGRIPRLSLVTPLIHGNLVQTFADTFDDGSMAKAMFNKNEELLKTTSLLGSEISQQEPKGQRGKTNNRKIKPRKKSKNGRK